MGRSTGRAAPVVVGAVVATVAVTDCEPLPLICTDGLERVQVGGRVAAGVTAQLRFTVPENDPLGASAKVKVALFPAATVCELGDGAAIVKSGVTGAWMTSDSVALVVSDPAVP